MIGKVLWFDVKKGFGFVRADNQDIFVHYSKIIADPGEFRTLETGDLVEFELFFSERNDGNKKPQAKNIKILQEGGNNEILREKPSSAIGGHAISSEESSIQRGI